MPRKRGYEPLTTEDWAKLYRSNVVAGLRVALPVGYAAGDETPPPPPVETYHLLSEDSYELLTEGGDNIDYDFI